MKSRRAVVLGALGLIGSEVVKKFLSLGTSIVVVDKRPPQRPLANLKNISWFCGSIEDIDLLDRAIQHGDDIFHFAESSFPGHPQEWEEGLSALQRLERLCRFVQERDCRLIYPSSGGTVYGRSVKTPIPEDHPLNPVSPYGLFKKLSEEILQYFKRTCELRFCIMRISNCYGLSFRSDKKQGIVGVAAKSILAGQTIRLVAEGKQVRDFVHAKDVAEFCGLIHLSEEDGFIVNVGNGVGFSMLDVIRTVACELNISPVIELLPARPFDVESSVLDPTRAFSLLGWSAKISFKDGVREICDNLRKGDATTEKWN